MSDTKKHTEKNNAAPYIKKDGRNKIDESSKSNFVIPLILLLVSAIVIFATFYEDEYKNLMASIDIQTDATENTATIVDATGVETTDADATVIDTEVTTTESITTAIQTTATQDETVATTEQADTQTKTDGIISTEKEKSLTTTTVAKVQTAESIDKTTADAQVERSEITVSTTLSKDQNNNLNNNAQQNVPSPVQPVARTQHAGNSVYNQQHYQAGVSRAREQAKQYYEMMQQRRQAYKSEIQSRRQQYEATMLAQREKRAKIYEANKAVFASAQKDRIATKQKVEELHKKISTLHEEVHQILRESHTSYDRTDTNQQTHSEPEVEKM